MINRVYRANGTALVEGLQGDNPKLMCLAHSDGRESLYLEFFMGEVETVSRNGKRYKKKIRKNERLGLFLWQAPRNAQERQHNKQTLELARKIRFDRAQKLAREGGRGMREFEDVDLLDWMQGYIDAYTKKDIRMVRYARKEFIEFLEQSDRYRHFAGGMSPKALTRDVVMAFVEYVKPRHRGEGAHTLYARFKKMIKAAVDEELLDRDPCHGICIKVDKTALTKDILSMDEIQRLASTEVERGSEVVHRAFLFCLFSGLRFCDVKELTFANVDFSNRLLRFDQRKTSGLSVSSFVTIPLGDMLLSLIGERRGRDELVFDLPSHTMCLKALRRWVARAGIDKHITWHCARHSFAVNILNNGANIKTVASLLGHSGLQHTEKYTRAVDALKFAAINSLPRVELPGETH